ncbi:MAG: N-acetylmuramoyl-L-alanine amidase [Gemmatimonadetes bacterium]|nr:N-acetylmuramoyl-L-alanine amidase [Gemmatimonadota bacterium]
MRRLLALAFLPLAVPSLGSAQDLPLIYIDPGHGGDQPGVVVDGLEEEDFVLRWGFLLSEAFSGAGYETRMSRSGDVGPSFQERIDRASADGADLFLSLHINRDDDPSMWGTEIFLAEELGPTVEAAEAVAAELESLGAKVTLIGQSWEVLKTTAFPTLMIELGHLSHPVERRLVTSRAYWEEVSMALVAAADEMFDRR